MDPKFQPTEPTFETTLTDVSELRRGARLWQIAVILITVYVTHRWG